MKRTKEYLEERRISHLEEEIKKHLIYMTSNLFTADDIRKKNELFSEYKQLTGRDYCFKVK